MYVNNIEERLLQRDDIELVQIDERILASKLGNMSPICGVLRRK